MGVLLGGLQGSRKFSSDVYIVGMETCGTIVELLVTLHIISVVLGCGLEQGYDLRVVPLLCDH